MDLLTSSPSHCHNWEVLCRIDEETEAHRCRVWCWLPCLQPPSCLDPTSEAPPLQLLRPQGLPLLQERRCHRLLPIHVPAAGRAGHRPGPKPDQEGSATPQVSKGPRGSGGGLGGAEEGIPRLQSVCPGPGEAVLGQGRWCRGAQPGGVGSTVTGWRPPPTRWGWRRGGGKAEV